MIDQPGQENISRGHIKPFAYVSPSLRRKFHWGGNQGGLRQPLMVSVGGGFTLSSRVARSDLFVAGELEWPFVQWVSNGHRWLKLAISLRGKATLHTSGVELRPPGGASRGNCASGA